MNRKALVAGAGVGTLLVVLGAAVYASADIVERGHLLPWAGADVRKVRVFDRFDFYISSETRKPSADLVNSYVLLATAAASLTGALILESRRARQLLAVAGIGIAYLAIDEQFAIHESLGHNLRFLADLPGVERPDDVVLAAYAVPSTVFLVYFWPVLRSSPRATALLLTALALFAAGALWDAAGLPAEEAVELAPSLVLLAAFLVLLRALARREKVV